MENSVISAIQAATRGYVALEMGELAHSKSRETEKAEQALEAVIRPMKTDRAEMMRELAADLTSAYEDLGFQNGFRMAVRLMAECQ
ncbi:hypothetical protein [Oscillibacter sp.]|uniref:hypothetical protein n=1 Tax=Oscillibacter sp. TaxID=1945593 RepID=UPI00289E8981|nr:hypothetical protein [Oscillibacter sp.]